MSRRSSASLQSKKRFLKIAITNGEFVPCYICGTALTLENYTLDHYIPLIAGGSNKDENIRFCCEPCNKKKGNTVPTKPIPAKWDFRKGAKND